jgi:two-component system, OmpR family, sensor kinase
MAPSPTHQARLLDTLEKLLEMPGAELRTALVQASDLVAAALHADKVDAFLYDDERDSLVAVGSSNQPLSAQQRKHGLDVLPLANGGRCVHIFQRRTTFENGRVQEDRDELLGIREVLRVASQVGAPLSVGGVVRGVLLACSQKPDFFSTEDVRFVETVARWIGAVAHRAELVEQIGRDAAERGRRRAAEDLITVLAHDLRNYMHPIDGRLQLVRVRLERDARTADLRDIDIARRGLARLGGIIADILETARIEQGELELELEPVDVVKLVKEVGTTLATETQPIQVRTEEDVVAMIDASRIRRCVENLVANAIKYSPRGAPVHVLVRRRESESGELVRIEVIDEGPGIPQDIAPHIFDRFFTARARSGGLGLGLFVARGIATMHGGDLTVETSEPGKGAHFVLSLPLAR